MDKDEGIIVLPEWGAVGGGGENLGNTGSENIELSAARPTPSPPPPERRVSRGRKKGEEGGGDSANRTQLFFAYCITGNLQLVYPSYKKQCWPLPSSYCGGQ